MKKQTTQIIGGVAIIIIVILAIVYFDKPKVPVIGEDGKINGNYSIEGVMNLKKTYVCKFDKKDENSEILGVMTTDGEKIYGEFRIKSNLIKNNFSSFLIIKDKKSYTWTSLTPLGYKSDVAKSSKTNVSPQEQSQLIGLRDELPYECDLLQNIDQTIFDVPTWINFTDLSS
jgi:hypothetical protein